MLIDKAFELLKSGETVRLSKKAIGYCPDYWNITTKSEWQICSVNNDDTVDVVNNKESVRFDRIELCEIKGVK